MKKTVLIFIVTMLLIACSDDSSPGDGLPPETRTGANTFGCLIDGKLYKPRCEKPSTVFPEWGALVWGSTNPYNYNEIEIRDLKSEHGFNLLLHIDGIYVSRVGNYQINESNGYSNIDGLDHTYLHCVIYDKTTNSYKKYVSFENSGEVNVTRYTLGTSSTGTIISGTFSGKLRNIQNPNDEVEITSGRFDLNSLTVIYHEFP